MVRPIYQIMVFFALAQVLAIAVGATLISNVATTPAYQVLDISPVGGEELINIFYFLVIIIVSAMMFLVVLWLPIRDVAIRVIEFIATFVSSSVVFFVLFDVAGLPKADALGVVVAIMLFGARTVHPAFRNVLAIVSSAGVGARIGFSIDPLPAVIFIIAIAIYDVLAVWWTGHMVQFARYFSKMKTSFTVSAESIKEVTVGRAKKLQPVFMELGSGDLALPAALTVSAFKLGGIFFSVAVFGGGAIGLWAVLKKVERERVIMPAMPSIALCALIALFLAIVVRLMGT